jgi:hypothetical protein
MSAAHENSAPYAMTALGWWRTDVARETSYAYWRDIHGTLAARIPGSTSTVSCTSRFPASTCPSRRESTRRLRPSPSMGWRK